MATIESSSSAPTASTATIAAEDALAQTPKGSSTTAEPHSFLEKQNEGVLRDVLDELDRERSQRAEMEARLRKMEQELQNQQKRINGTTAMSPTSQRNGGKNNNIIQNSREFLTLQAERDGYLEIVNALTQDRPAFSKKQQRLPIHVVRLLEIIPWDPRARQHLFGQETLFEWQILGADKTWQTQLRYFPTVFKTLPIVIPQPGKTVGEAPTSSSPPKQCVLTNLQVTQILNIDKGYPLPQDGGDWVWVGGWRIEKHSDSDADGWSYSNDLDLTLDSSYYSEFRLPQRGTKNIVKRRRKWTRSRVMIDYPQASAMTKEYLKMVAEKASLDVSVQKLSTQLVETKMKLTTLEAEHLTLKEETNRTIAKLEKELEDKNRVLEIIQTQDGFDAATISNLASKKDQVKELRSVVTAWVNNTVSKRQVVAGAGGGSGDTVATEASDGQSQHGRNEEEEEAVAEKSIVAAAAAAATTTTTPSKTSSDVKQLMFDSLKGKGTDLFEKIKQKGGEEIEKIKKQKGRPGGLSSWTASRKTSEEGAAPPPSADTTQKEETSPSPKVELI